MSGAVGGVTTVPRPTFGGTGAAGAAWKATLALLAAVALLIALYAAMAWRAAPTEGDQDAGSWSILLLFAFGWMLGATALVAWALATLLAAAGRGRLARPVLGLGGGVFALGAALSAASLPATGAPGIVLVALAACVGGLAASLAAWRREARPAPGMPAATGDRP